MPTDEEIAAAVSATLSEALTRPRVVEGDAGRVEEHSIADLLAARKALQASAAAATATGPRRGIRYAKQLPPGAL